MAIEVYRTGGAAARAVLAVSAIALMAGCMENGGELFKSAPSSGGAGASTRLVERDVEAPEVFQATEAGLWDGRPSLGGVWVAHPDVTEPERALIRNEANGKFVIGALFRPSLERSGPRFQVSSDAAEALSMLAGQPQTLNVTALRREEVAENPPATEPAPETTVAATEMPAPEAVETAALDPVDTASSALDKVEAQQTATPVAGAEDEPAQKKRRWFWQKKDKPVETMDAGMSTGAGANLAAAEVTTEALAPSANPAPAPVASAPSPRPVSTLDKPYLQIGIFSVEQNAKNTAVAMRQAGIIPEVLKQSSKGKTFWRVIVGPATNSDERAVLLKKVKAAGFTDAYAVTN
ncbi:SPOR domain-containing protein [Pseudooceanicola sp.]|uniref:SPOR domain-containing protein n=1 Tax=Pseudooceanicola sp. TaxID=1914328 RepID=UPI0035C71038